MFTIISTIIVAVIGVAITAAKVGMTLAMKSKIESIISISNIDQIKGFDEMFTKLISQLGNMFANFMLYSYLLVAAAGLLCIIFNSFKLWAGTTEIKKAFVDMVYKCVLVMALMTVYPEVAYKVYDLATQTGVEISGGEGAILEAFGNIAKNTKNRLDKGLGPAIEILKKGAVYQYGQLTIPESQIEALKKNTTGATKEEIIAYCRSQGLDVVPDDSVWGRQVIKQQKAAGTYKVTNNAIDNLIDDNKKTLNSNKKAIKQGFAIVEALTQLFTSIPIDDMKESEGNTSYTYTAPTTSQILSMSDKEMQNVFYNPYIKNTKTLSMSTLIKTSIVIAEICSAGLKGNMSISDEAGNEQTLGNVLDSAHFPFVLDWVWGLFKWLVFKLGIVIAVIFLGIEYMMTTIEYFLVVAISSLLIPLFFIDATKQFATNILKMFFTFFVKLLVTALMCFFVMGIYINSCVTMMEMDLSGNLVIVFYVFVLCFGMMLAKASGKVASAVVSGNPSMGVGDMAHEFRGAAHVGRSAVHQAEKTAQNIKQTAQKAASGAGKIAQNGQQISAINKGSNLAGQSAAKDFRASVTDGNGNITSDGAAKLKSMGYSGDMGGLKNAEGDIANQASKDYKRAAFRQMDGDNFHKMFFGNDKIHEGGGLDGDGNRKFDGVLRYGQEFYDVSTQSMKKASLKDVFDSANAVAGFKNRNSNSIDKAIEKKKRQNEKKHSVFDDF